MNNSHGRSSKRLHASTTNRQEEHFGGCGDSHDTCKVKRFRNAKGMLSSSVLDGNITRPKYIPILRYRRSSRPLQLEAFATRIIACTAISVLIAHFKESLEHQQSLCCNSYTNVDLYYRHARGGKHTAFVAAF